MFVCSPSNYKVELQTVDGLVKDSTQCAPNGYYFIPVYDKVFIIPFSGLIGVAFILQVISMLSSRRAHSFSR